MKRYLLFEGFYYYPSGGWGDFVGDFDTIEEARDGFKLSSDGWYEIVDLEIGKVIEPTRLGGK